MIRKNRAIFLALFALLLFWNITGCAQEENELVEDTAVANIQPTASATLQSTSTSAPSSTPTQTVQATPTPTQTASPTPSLTPSPTPALQNLSASESQLINIPRTDFAISDMAAPN